MRRGFVLAAACLCCSLPTLQAQNSAQKPKLRGYFTHKPARRADVEKTENQAEAQTAPTLPIWTFDTESPRDNNNYTGVMIGHNPFNGGGSSSVPAYVIPVIMQTNTIGQSVSSHGIISTSPGATRFDPTSPDRSCLDAPNNVPLNLVTESPILRSANFNFGGTPVGRTQYVDAFQRANFWREIGGSVSSDYHVLLTPHVLSPIFINVPAKYGTTLPQSDYPTCGPLGIVDINWFDALLDNQVLPRLASQGVNPSNFPILLVHDVVWAAAVTNLHECCFLGYHGTTAFPIQTYSPVDFDSTGLFGSSAEDTTVMSHEVAEWMDDPFGNNATPAWGNTGQVAGCQNNLEVGDPLTGTQVQRIHMPNGFTYHLQELAFFSWFFGGPSIGVNGWYSDDGTFLTGAGPVCQSTAATSGAALDSAGELKIAPIQ